MFTNNFKLDGIEDILNEMGYLSEEAKDENDAGKKDDKKGKKSKKEKEDKPKRWWDDDGDGIGYEKGEVDGKFKKEEAEQVDEIMKHQQERDRIEADKAHEADRVKKARSAYGKLSRYSPPTKGKHGEIERRQAQRPPSRLRSGSLPEEYMDEDGKMQGGGKDPCWKGYEMVGKKMKGGREVPNCVPKEEYTELYFDMLEEGYTLDQVREVLAAYEDGYEVIFEEDGVIINDTQEVLDEEFLSDVEMVADWLVAEGIIEDEDEFFELMEDLSEEEIEELYDVVTELYKGKHGQTEKEYQDSRSNAGKMVSGTSTMSGAAYSSRGVQNTGPNPAGGSKKPQGQGRMTSGQRTEMQYRKANLKARKEGVEMIGNSLEEGGLEVRNFSWDEVMKEAWKKKAMKKEGYQRTPEKSDKEDRKYEPVRGEKTPMPPRGNKRREDFEKWYAANVR